jgi:hypothetical protein
MLLCTEKILRELIPRTQERLLRTEHDGEIYTDYLVEITTAALPT